MKRYLAILVAAMMMVCLLAGCAGGDKATGGEKETLIIGEAGQWWGLDTTLLDGSNFTQGLVADPLVVLDENGNMQPCIASAVAVSDDGKDNPYHPQGNEVRFRRRSAAGRCGCVPHKV